MGKLRVTKTLLDSWLWSFKLDTGYDDFIKCLNRIKTPPTMAQLEGLRFENCLNNVLLGEQLPDDHEWKFPITEMAEQLYGSQQQVVLFRDIKVEEQDVLLHGILDYLHAGEIYDCKFTKRYTLNKYLTSTTQCSMYMTMLPEAYCFTYLISDGKYVYRERYPREIVPDIDNTINQFYRFLKQHDLWKTYVEKWSVSN